MANPKKDIEIYKPNKQTKQQQFQWKYVSKMDHNFLLQIILNMIMILLEFLLCG